MKRLFSSRVFPWIAGGTAFVLYALTRAPGYMPGASAYSLVQALPDSDFPTFGFTLWHTLVQAADRLPVSLGVAGTWMAAATGAVTIGALVRIAYGLSLGDTAEEQRTPVPANRMRGVAVGVTLLVSMWTLPLWFAHTRPFPQAFGLMLIAVTGAWTLDTFRKRSMAMLNVSALLWGWVVTENAAAWFFLPGFALAVLMTGFDVSGRFRWGRNLRLLFLFLLAAGLGYLWMSLKVLHHPSAPLQSIHSLGDAFLDSLRVQRNQMRAAAPDRGSLLVLFLFGGPFLVALMPKRQATLDIRIGSILLHAACALINGLMLFHPAFSPWGLYQSGALREFMVVPYAMLAVSSGYLCAYWIAVLFQYDPYQPLYLRVPRYLLRLLIVPVLVAVLAGSTVWNAMNWRDPHVEEVNHWAKVMAGELSGVPMYWGNPGFPAVLQLTLRDQGGTTRILNPDPVLWSRQAYRNVVAQGFRDQPRLASMAEIGAYPLITALSAEWDDFSTRFRLSDRPDLLYRLGRTPVPVPFGYQGEPEANEASSTRAAERLFDLWGGMEVEGFWEDLENEHRLRRAGHVLLPFYAMESRRANNLGVYLEDEGRVEEALEAYWISRRLMPGNVSALLNLLVHRDRLPTQQAEQIDRDAERLQESVGDARFDFWRLSSHYGYVRNPGFHVQRGLGWAVTGKANLAVKEYREALLKAPSALLRVNLAGALAADALPEEARREYETVLAEDPENVPALMGLLRLHASLGELVEARAYVERLREAGADANAVYEQDVQLTLMEGRVDAVKTLAETWHRERPNQLTPVLVLVGLALGTGDADAAETWLAQAEGIGPGTDEERLRYARLLFQLGRGSQARGVLGPLLEGGPRFVAAHSLLLDEAVRQQDMQAARRHVREILNIEPRNAQAHYVLGTLHHADGRLSEAEASLRTSLETRESAPVLNHLAYILLVRGRTEEALPFTRRSVELDPSASDHWDTLASVLLELGRVDEAYQAQIQALSQRPDHPPYRLTLARILAAQGKEPEVAVLLDELFREMDSLSVAQRQQLRDLAGDR